MSRVFALLMLGILLLGCTLPETGAGQQGTRSGTGGSGGRIVGVGETIPAGGGAPQTGSREQETVRGGSGGAIVGIEQPEPGPGDVVVHIRNFQFEPRDVTVRQGKTVFWYNEDSTPHSVRMIGVFDSPPIAKDGGPYWHTFTEYPGRYEYSCGIHGAEAGTVTVVR